MREVVRPFAGLLATVVALTGCATGVADPVPTPTETSAPARPAPPTPPAPASPSAASPEPPGPVRTALTEVERGEAPLTGLAVIHRGKPRGEAYGPGLDATTPQPVWSVTKSVVSALVGIAVDEGLLALDTPATELFGDAAADHPDLTVEDLLTMRSGLDLGDSDAGLRQLYATDDWVAAALDRPAAHPPGEVFRYCSVCVHLLTAALQDLTGDLAGWADARLFAPLGLGDVTWGRAPDGVPIGGWGLELTAAQMARFGQLYLAGGSWDGEQLVPAAWVGTSVVPHTAAGGDFDAAQVGYGYLWWVRDGGGYAATGRGGQLVVVVPDSDLVVAATAELSDEDAFRAFAYVWTRIVAAFPLS